MGSSIREENEFIIKQTLAQLAKLENEYQQLLKELIKESTLKNNVHIIY